MPRPKKPEYEWVEKLQRYRKRIKDSDGKYVALYGKTPKELEAKIEEATRIIEEGQYRLINPTVREYFEKWLDLHAAHVRITTLNDYRSIVKLYIIETMGDYYMFEITPDLIREKAIAKASKMSKTVFDKTVMLLKMVFQSAVDSDIIDDNPADKISSVGGNPPKEKIALTDEQAAVLLEAVKNTPAYPFCMIGLYTGLRREEILALQWDCVNLKGDAPFIKVCRAWHTEHNRPVVSDELKTKAARRSVPVPAALKTCLEELQKNKTESKYVIANASGEPLSGSQWRNLWNNVIKRTTRPRKYKRRLDNGELQEHVVTPVLGEAAAHNPDCVYSIDFEITPHVLRHTYISNLILSGIDVATVQYLAGHENSKITLDIYTHLKTNQPEDLYEKVKMAFC